MPTVNSSSHVLHRYEVSLVKYDDPGFIIFDMNYEDCDMMSEIKNIKAMNEKITEHCNKHADDPIDGRRFFLGEVVAVNVVSTWKAAMIVNFKFVDGLHHYELVLLDSGHVVEGHRMAFRHVEDVDIIPRFAFFVIMDLLPTADDTSAQSSWNIDACQNLQLMFDLASSITVDVMARQQFCNSERLFGNIYLHVGKYVIDVKDMLIKQGAAYNDAVTFKRAYTLEDVDVPNQNREEVEDLIQKSEKSEYGKVEVQEITDENLDRHLLEWWRLGGADPLTQQERLSVRNKLMSETRISFAHHQSQVGNASTSDLDLDNSLPQSKKSEYSDSTKVEQGNQTVLRGKYGDFKWEPECTRVYADAEYKQSNGMKFKHSKDSDLDMVNGSPQSQRSGYPDVEKDKNTELGGKFLDFKWEPKSRRVGVDIKQTKGIKFRRSKIQISHREFLERQRKWNLTDLDWNEDEVSVDTRLLRKPESSFTSEEFGSNGSSASSKSSKNFDAKEAIECCVQNVENSVRRSGNLFFKDGIELPSEEDVKKMLALFQETN